MRLEYQDNIDRYLLNRMSDEERILFESKCASNPELKEQLEHTRDVQIVISERNKLLEKIQKWDEEYEKEKKASARKKRVAIYWVSGIAAVLVVGFFLNPYTNLSVSENDGSYLSLNQDSKGEKTGSSELGSCVDIEDSNRLLAQNDNHHERESEKVFKQEAPQVFSFEMTDVDTTTDTTKQKALATELKQIDEKINVFNKDISQLRQQLDEGEINQDFYDSFLAMLKNQRDYLLWRKVHLLLEMGIRNDALEILRDLRKEDGVLRSKADSLYKEIH